jgi:hypothetical protein
VRTHPAGSGAWLPWSGVVPALSIAPGAAFGDMIVPTVDTARHGPLPLLALRIRGYQTYQPYLCHSTQPRSEAAAMLSAPPGVLPQNACARAPAQTHHRPSSSPFIPIRRYTYLFDLSLRHRYPLLLAGPTGTGKTTLVMRHLLGRSGGSGAAAAGDGLDGGGAAAPPPALVGGVFSDKWVPVFLTLSARTSANVTQDQVTRGQGAGDAIPRGW